MTAIQVNYYYYSFRNIFHMPNDHVKKAGHKSLVFQQCLHMSNYGLQYGFENKKNLTLCLNFLKNIAGHGALSLKKLQRLQPLFFAAYTILLLSFVFFYSIHQDCYRQQKLLPLFFATYTILFWLSCPFFNCVFLEHLLEL